MKVKSDKHLKMKKMCCQIKFGHLFHCNSYGTTRSVSKPCIHCVVES